MAASYLALVAIFLRIEPCGSGLAREGGASAKEYVA